MELLYALLGLISIHAVFVAAEFAFVKAAHSEVMENENNLGSILSAAICRKLEDYLRVCAGKDHYSVDHGRLDGSPVA